MMKMNTPAYRPVLITPPPSSSIQRRRRYEKSLYSVWFHQDEIHVTVAMKADDVKAWIRNVRQTAGRGMKLVGLDTEWHPNFNPKDDHPIATLQLCIGNQCLIFQILHAHDIARHLRKFLVDGRFIFCGVGVEDDVKKLYDHYGLHVLKTMDLNEAACMYGPWYRYMGLKKLATVFLGEEMLKPKEVTLSAWDALVLDDRQVEYAAIDAFVSFKIASVLSGRMQ